MNYLMVENGLATLYHYDNKAKKYYAISSEDNKVAFYRFKKLKPQDITEVPESSVANIRKKYPEEFL